MFHTINLLCYEKNRLNWDISFKPESCDFENEEGKKIIDWGSTNERGASFGFHTHRVYPLMIEFSQNCTVSKEKMQEEYWNVLLWLKYMPFGKAG